MSELSKAEYNILSIVKDNPNISVSKLAHIRSEELSVTYCRLAPLKKQLMLEIGINDNDEQTFKITAEALAAISEYETTNNTVFWKKFEDRFWKLVPLIISIISLLKSYNII